MHYIQLVFHTARPGIIWHTLRALINFYLWFSYFLIIVGKIQQGGSAHDAVQQLCVSRKKGVMKGIRNLQVSMKFYP